MPTLRGSVVGPIRRPCRPRPGSTSPRINPNKLNTRVPLDLTDTGPPRTCSTPSATHSPPTELTPQPQVTPHPNKARTSRSALNGLPHNSESRGRRSAKDCFAELENAQVHSPPPPSLT